MVIELIFLFMLLKGPPELLSRNIFINYSHKVEVLYVHSM